MNDFFHRHQPSSFQSSPRSTNATYEIGGRSGGNASSTVTRELSESARETVVAEGEFKSMPISLGDFFEDEAFCRSFRTIVEDDVCHAWSIDNVVPQSIVGGLQ